MVAGTILSAAIGSAVVCGIWTAVCVLAASPLIVCWVGFAGCTSYYTAGGGPKGFLRSMASNCAGILIGCTIIAMVNAADGSSLVNILSTGFFSGVIVWLVHFDVLKFSTCTFIGGFSAFATGGDWKMLLICLFLGNIVGITSDYLGRLLYRTFFEKKNTAAGKSDWILLKLPENEE